jgi:hypothetical protein
MQVDQPEIAIGGCRNGKQRTRINRFAARIRAGPEERVVESHW